MNILLKVFRYWLHHSSKYMFRYSFASSVYVLDVHWLCLLLKYSFVSSLVSPPVKKLLQMFFIRFAILENTAIGLYWLRSVLASPLIKVQLKVFTGFATRENTAFSVHLFRHS